MYITTLTWMWAVGGGGDQIRKSRSQLHLKISVTVSVYFTNKGIIMFSLNIIALFSTPFSTEISKGSTIFFSYSESCKIETSFPK